jgi:hypothetical protein
LLQEKELVIGVGEEVIAAVPAFTDNRYDGIELVQGFLQITQEDWRSLATVLCKARRAWLTFSKDNCFVELRKETDEFRLRVEVRSGL